jgi:hypothetical protein
LAAFWIEPALWSLLALLGLVGAVAVLSPRHFSRLTKCSSQWVDTDRILSTLDRKVDIDKHVLPYSRALGMAVLCSVAIFAWLYVRYLAH